MASESSGGAAGRKKGSGNLFNRTAGNKVGVRGVKKIGGKPSKMKGSKKGVGSTGLGRSIFG